jgi:AGCS family alanine or glycine:cation symporter
MADFELFLSQLKDLVWGVPLLTFLLGTGLYLTFLLRGIQFSYMGFALKQIFKSPKGSKGDINPYEALMTSLAGAIGTGAIVGVSTGLAIGGLGSLFWMWVTAFLGMATKYAESLLAVKYRVIDKRGEMSGGPMQYMERGLKMKWMAILFASFGAIAAIGTGNLVQVNSIAEAMKDVWSLNVWLTGVVLAIITAVVIVGGVKSIGHVAGVLVPFMAIFYVAGGLIIILLNISQVPAVFFQILDSAFTGDAAVGGFVASGVILVIQLGVSRSVFSNEAGLGISSIAAAAAKTDSPGRQAMITMTGALISTIIVCTITGFVLAVTGTLGLKNEAGELLNGAPLAIKAFNSGLWGGHYIVTVGLILFAYSTVIAWAFYGEKCFEYIFGERSVVIYRIIFCLLIIPGTALKMETVWYLADITNGLMIVPNLVALLLLSSVISSETNKFLLEIKKEK